MVAIQSSLGMAAYGKTAQLGGNTNDRARQQIEKKEEALKAVDERREAAEISIERVQDIRPPQPAARSEDADTRHSAPPRGSMVDIAV